MTDTWSPEQSRDRSCRGKIRFKSERQALIYNERMVRTRGHEVLRAYKCIWCPGWHLTSKMRWEDDE